MSEKEINEQLLAAVKAGDSEKLESLFLKIDQFNTSAKSLAQEETYSEKKRVEDQGHNSNNVKIPARLFEFSKDDEGCTIIHRAAEKGSYAIFELLVNKLGQIDQLSLNINAENKEGKTPLDYAQKNSDIAKFLSDRKARSGRKEAKKDLQPETKKGIPNSKEEEIVKLLREAGEINKPDEQGRTYLHKALEAGDSLLAGNLVRAGADLYAEDIKYETPMDCLQNCKKFTPDDKTILIKDLNRLAKSARAVMNFQLSEGKMSEILQILEKSENLHELPSLKLGAGYRNDSAIVQKLAEEIKSSGKINTIDEKGRTAMHLALEKGDSLTLIAKALAAAGADINAKDINGKTSIDYLRNNKDIEEEVKKWLINDLNQMYKEARGNRGLGDKLDASQILNDSSFLQQNEYINKSPKELTKLLLSTVVEETKFLIEDARIEKAGKFAFGEDSQVYSILANMDAKELAKKFTASPSSNTGLFAGKKPELNLDAIMENCPLAVLEKL